MTFLLKSGSRKEPHLKKGTGLRVTSTQVDCPAAKALTDMSVALLLGARSSALDQIFEVFVFDLGRTKVGTVCRSLNIQSHEEIVVRPHESHSEGMHRSGLKEQRKDLQSSRRSRRIRV